MFESRYEGGREGNRGEGIGGEGKERKVFYNELVWI